MANKFPVAAFGIMLAAACGCGSDLPATYPVKGKVVFKGGKVVADGRIEFHSVADAELVATGDIEPDGSFSLVTFKRGKQRAGAVEGQHKVVVELERPRETIAVPKLYSVTAQENHLTIEVQRKKR